MLMNEVDNPIAPNAVGITAFQFALQGFALKRIAPQIIQRMGDSLVERTLALCHAADDALGLVGEFKLIDGQGRL